MAKVCPEPSRDRSAADMGIRAHAASAAALRTVTRDGGPISINADGLDPEHLAACSVYVDDVASEMRKRAIFGGPNLGIERPVLCELVHPQCWGYVDAWLYHLSADRIILWDFKAGAGPVDVVENWQMLCYAAGLVQLCGVGLNHPTLQIEMRIVQPRARSGAPIKRWVIDAQRLAGYVETLSRAAFEAHDNPQCRPGPQCWKCSAGASCPSMDDLCADIAEYLRTPQTRHLNAEQIGVELRRLRYAKKALSDRLEAVESQAEHMMRTGTHIPDLMLKASYGNLEWTDTEPLMSLSAKHGVRLLKPQAYVTPTQAIKEGVPEDVVKELSKRAYKGHRAVTYDPKQAERIFK
jgi:hypothetical protein